MPIQVDKLTAVHSLQKVIDHTDYNRIRLALQRIKQPIRVTLEDMRCLDVIIDDDCWLCVDTCMNDRPVMAWVSFKTSGRSGLNESVACELRIYHIQGGLVMGKVLENIGKEIEKRLGAL